jgi:hypothetical protein
MRYLIITHHWRRVELGRPPVFILFGIDVPHTQFQIGFVRTYVSLISLFKTPPLPKPYLQIKQEFYLSLKLCSILKNGNCLLLPFVLFKRRTKNIGSARLHARNPRKRTQLPCKAICSFLKEPKTVALRGFIPEIREADPEGLGAGPPKTILLVKQLFFFKKEPKTVALRGFIPEIREADPGGLGAGPQKILFLVKQLFFFKKEPKIVALRDFMPEIREADPGGLGAGPQKILLLVKQFPRIQSSSSSDRRRGLICAGYCLNLN